MEENYKLADFNEFTTSHLLERCKTGKCDTQSDAQNENDKPDEENLNKALQLFNESTEEIDNYDAAFSILNSEIRLKTTSKLEIVFSKSFLNIIMKEISLNTSYSEYALRILCSLSYTKEHCDEMVDHDIKGFIPILFELIKNCNNSYVICITDNLLSHENIRNIILEDDTIDFSPVYESMSNEEDYMLHVANIIYYLSTKYTDTCFQEQSVRSFIFSFDSSFNVAFTFLQYFKNISSNKETFDAALYAPIVNSLNINYKRMPHYIILLGELIDTYSELINVDLDFLIDGERLKDEIDIASAMCFIGIAIRYDYYKLNDDIGTQILAAAVQVYPDSSFYSKKWIMIAILSVLINAPFSFYEKIDLSDFFDLFEEMFANDVEEEIGNRIILFILTCYKNSLGVNESITEIISSSGIIQTIGEYIDDCSNSNELYQEFTETFKSE